MWFSVFGWVISNVLKEPNAFVFKDLMVQKEHSELFERVDTMIKDTVFGLECIHNGLSIQQLHGKKSSEEWGEVSWFGVYSICNGKLKRMGSCYKSRPVFTAKHSRRSSVMRVRMKSDARLMAHTYKYKRRGLILGPLSTYAWTRWEKSWNTFQDSFVSLPKLPHRLWGPPSLLFDG